MESPLTIKASGPRSFLFYGPPGTGKTRTAAMAKYKKKLFVDVDQKLESMENLPEEARKGISIWTPQETLSVHGQIAVIRQERTEAKGERKIAGTENYIPSDPRGYTKTVDFINELLKRSENGNFGYDLVVLDSFTNLVEHMFKIILSHHKTAIFSLPLWGVYKANFQEFLYGFLSLPCHRIMIGHSKMIQDEITKEVTIRPMLDGQMADNIAKDFNEVYFFQGRNREGKYTVKTQSDKKHVARSTKGFDDEITIEDLLERI